MERNSVPIKKQCCHCRHVKPLTEFYKAHNLPTGRKPRCKECTKLYRIGKISKYQKQWRDYYQKHKERIRQYNKDNRERFRKRRTDYKKRIRIEHKQILVKEHGGKCILCDYDRPFGLDFHHKEPSQKEFSIGRNVGIKTLNKLRAEASKCVLLCAACHRALHAGLIQLPKEGI